MKQLITLFFTLLFMNSLTAQTVLQGKVSDETTNEGLPFATIQITRNDVFIGGVNTDLDGNYRYLLEPGTYDLNVSYIGYKTVDLKAVEVLKETVNTVDIALKEKVETYKFGLYSPEYIIPLINKDNTAQGIILTSKKIRQLPTRSIPEMASQAAGLSIQFK